LFLGDELGRRSGRRRTHEGVTTPSSLAAEDFRTVTISFHLIEHAPTRPFAAFSGPMTWFGNDAPLLQHSWHPVLLSSELKDEPVRVDVGDRAWAVVRLGDQVAAYPDLCPHRRVPLSIGTVVGDELVCGYHGWRFDVAGRCTSIPALGPDATVPRGMGSPTAGGVCESDGFIWLAPQEPVTTVPTLPSLPGRDLVWGSCPPRTTHASIGVLLDNFLDVAHFSYLHSQTIGVTVPLVVDDFEVTTAGAVLTACHQATVSQAEGGVTRVTRYDLNGPTSLALDLDFPDTNFRVFIVFWLHALGTDKTVVHKMIGCPAEGAETLAGHVEFEVRILEEDLSMVELIQDPRLPLELRAEQHTRADRAGVALRRMLATAPLPTGEAG
jgi:phenylpropionate dioxygenase-like ring-hydroxylating dioxygenase large terminal subunit